MHKKTAEITEDREKEKVKRQKEKVRSLSLIDQDVPYVCLHTFDLPSLCSP